MGEAWNDKFPPLNLYNHPSYGVVDVWAEAVKLGVVAVPDHIKRTILYGVNNNGNEPLDGVLG
jgi:hypothetical protein